MSEHKHEGCCSGHEHEHHEHCGCGHHEEQHHEEEHHEHAHMSEDVPQKIYIIENLGCANCAAKMEKKISELPQVEGATLTFATKQLRVASYHQEELLPLIQEICASIESEVVVREQEERTRQKESKGLKKEQKTEILEIAVAAVLFVVAILLEKPVYIASVAVFVVSYLLLGRNILRTAAGNLFKGHVFDENFLMGIATLAAFAIGDFAEAVGVMLFFRIGELFEEIAVERSRGQIMEAVDLRPETVLVVHEQHTHEKPAKEAKIGDILVVRVGDRIPLDAVVVEGESRIDTAAVTGEPVPVKVTVGDEVISGCINTSGVLKIKVQKTLEDSMVTRILNSVEHAAASKPRIDRFITRFARVYTPIVVALAVATAVIPSIITGDYEKWIYTAISFLVISCPCALVLSVPLAFFSGIGAGSKRGILFKGGLAMEVLESIKAVVMDKTGTVTQGNFEVQSCVPLGQYTEDEILSMAMVCESQSTHPIAVSIVRAAKRKNLMIEKAQTLEEIAGKGVRAVTEKGTFLCGNRELMETYQVQLQSLRANGYGTEVLVACNGELVGYLVIADELKTDAKEAVGWMKRKGLKTIMLTGDSEESAKVIAELSGIETVYAKLLPEEKLEKLQNVRKEHGKVMFVGDGINDAPVLAGADIGAAMGSGADAAIEAADVVFMTSSMQAIPEAIQIAKTTNHIAIQNVVFALAIKAAVMVLGLLGLANMWMAVFADSGVAMLCVLNSIRILRRK